MNPQSFSNCQGLRELCRKLLAPGGCDWDRSQTIESLTPYLIEEAHEVVEAAAAREDARIVEELGDLLYLIVFAATIAEFANRFSFEDIAQAIAGKLIARHPHVFSSAERELDFAQVRLQWETIKRAEKQRRGQTPETLSAGAASLPALLLAYRVQEKAASYGFDWPDAASVMAKIEEECAELRAAIESEDRTAIEEEAGDLLFAMVNLARHLPADPDLLLRRAVTKFRARFAMLEARVKERGLELGQVDLETLERFWQEAKSQE